jgi:hypothetical protein
MPEQHGIYFESQKGGLCRLHALNAFFGMCKIDEHQFNKFIDEYDQEYKKKYNIETSCKTFDIVSSDQKNVVSYILKKNHVYTKYFAINQLFRHDTQNRTGKYDNACATIQDIISNDLRGDFFFAYTESHIYGIRRKDGAWYKVDSMGGVCPINIQKLIQKNMGFIFVIDIKDAFYQNLAIIKNILGDAPTIETIKEYLVQKNSDKMILGHLEIPMGMCMDILETNLLWQTDEFGPINDQVEKYNEFLPQFTNGRYNDIALILQYLPDLIFNLTKLNILNQ